MFPVPSLNIRFSKADVVHEGGEKHSFLHKTFFGISGKRIDEAKCECSLGNLSLNREWFFEIYFVRLIGTPNQHYSRFKPSGLSHF
jgi:hypothetical protein